RQRLYNTGDVLPVIPPRKHRLARETVLAIPGRLLTMTGNNGWIEREQQATNFLEHNVKNDL
nr:hypothetical protein [Tanacetum cinerariifolium]